MFDFRNTPLPFTTTDGDHDRVTIVARMPDGQYLGYWQGQGSDTGGHCYPRGYDPLDNDLKTPTTPVSRVVDWLTESANRHLLDAVKAFDIAGQKINGVKFIRSVVPVGVADDGAIVSDTIGCGLTVAKEAFERIAAERVPSVPHWAR